MNEMDVLQRLRDDVPVSPPVGHAETALLTAIRAERNASPAQLNISAATRTGSAGRRAVGLARHRIQLAVGGGVSLALAAGIIAAVTTGGTHRADTLTVRELAYRAAAAASAQPKVRAGQWLYWREQTIFSGKKLVWNVWTTADGRHAAYVHDGKVHLIKQSPGPVRQFVGQPVISARGVSLFTTLNVSVPVRYADLGKLPKNPRALYRYLGHLPLPKFWGPPPTRAYFIISILLQTFVMPPHLTAELYRTLADVPGVTVDHHATDLAGRPGVGFVFKLQLAGFQNLQELVINPHTYRLMGAQWLSPRPSADGDHRVLGGAAILRKAFVKGPGVSP